MNVHKELTDSIDMMQSQLKAAIFRHQSLYAILEKDETNEDLRREVVEAVQEVTRIGLEQKIFFNRLRADRDSQATHEEKNRTEEEDRPALESSNSNEVNLRESFSDNSIEVAPQSISIYPENMELVDFMVYFGVGTHEVHDKMVKKRSTRGKCAAAIPYYYMPIDVDYRKKMEQKQKYFIRKWKTKPNTTKPNTNKRKRS